MPGNDNTEKGIIPMLQWLPQFLTAPIINGFLDAYKAKLAAANAQGAQAVEVARTALMAEIEARRNANAIILAEQGRWYTAIIRPLLATPVVIYLWKVIVWDIVLNLGTTDPIGGDVAEWAGWIATAYVGGRSLEKIARTIWRRPCPRAVGRASASPCSSSRSRTWRPSSTACRPRSTRCTRSSCRRAACAGRSSRSPAWWDFSPASRIG